MGTLETRPAPDATELLAAPVAKALTGLDGDVYVAPIDPTLADTAAFCEAYEVGLDVSANCVIVAGKRGDRVTYAACLVLATTRADVNGTVRRLIDARKASFAPMDDAVELTGMEYGGITPIGLPSEWRILIDSRVDATPWVIIGSGIRGSKILIEGALLKKLPNAEVITDLAA
ncbi:YbaK/EbsC family protein [Allocatelliglobosispora scoriae]|nr:YbaK/EbsC family protein [Allocatelliglobosispora scoriae]